MNLDTFIGQIDTSVLLDWVGAKTKWGMTSYNSWVFLFRILTFSLSNTIHSQNMGLFIT